MIVSEQDIVHNWLTGNTTPTNVVVEDDHFVNIYNSWCNEYDIEDCINAIQEDTSDNYVEQCTHIDNWNMPDNYKQMDIKKHLLQCIPSADKFTTEYKRVMEEFAEYEKRGMVPVLKFLKYLVDACDEHNVVLGVGRGSSVASYCLYLLGVHRIDSIKYELDIKEFLK